MHLLVCCCFVYLLAKQLKKLLMDFDQIFRKCRQWQKNRCFDFIGDPDHCLDPNIFKGYFISAAISKTGGVGLAGGIHSPSILSLKANE